MSRIIRPIPIALDKPRLLILDFNAVVAIEEKTGDNALSAAFWKNASPKRIRGALWGCLLHDKKDPITIEKVGDIIDSNLDRWEEITTALIEAWSEALPKKKEVETPAA